ncbi:hypothetical protein JOD54_001952 [Actinokineospora baliensis]|uniref:hypothetical protein n=1 Tax=Actinokineospora baliensis TaxID=547056 RepID=UPI001959F6C8|nr:hypothetical protein [Actinokineospora baliensis]MBM7771748.1 hypothetical protein [Actinokineospora baliensis]
MTLAQELIAADPAAAVLVPAAGIGNLRPLLPDPVRGGTSLVHVDTVYAMGRDLSVPLIVAPLEPLDGIDMGNLVIDGWHRVYKALAEGRTTLPAYFLTADTEREARFRVPYFPGEPR